MEKRKEVLFSGEGELVICKGHLEAPGIFQARILEWVAITSSRGSSQPRDQT